MLKLTLRCTASSTATLVLPTRGDFGDDLVDVGFDGPDADLAVGRGADVDGALDGVAPPLAAGAALDGARTVGGEQKALAVLAEVGGDAAHLTHVHAQN